MFADIAGIPKMDTVVMFLADKIAAAVPGTMTEDASRACAKLLGMFRFRYKEYLHGLDPLPRTGEEYQGETPGTKRRRLDSLEIDYFDDVQDVENDLSFRTQLLRPVYPLSVLLRFHLFEGHIEDSAMLAALISKSPAIREEDRQQAYKAIFDKLLQTGQLFYDNSARCSSSILAGQLPAADSSVGSYGDSDDYLRRSLLYTFVPYTGAFGLRIFGELYAALDKQVRDMDPRSTLLTERLYVTMGSQQTLLRLLWTKFNFKDGFRMYQEFFDAPASLATEQIGLDFIAQPNPCPQSLVNKQIDQIDLVNKLLARGIELEPRPALPGAAGDDSSAAVSESKIDVSDTMSGPDLEGLQEAEEADEAAHLASSKRYDLSISKDGMTPEGERVATARRRQQVEVRPEGDMKIDEGYDAEESQHSNDEEEAPVEEPYQPAGPIGNILPSAVEQTQASASIDAPPVLETVVEVASAEVDDGYEAEDSQEERPKTKKVEPARGTESGPQVETGYEAAEESQAHTEEEGDETADEEDIRRRRLEQTLQQQQQTTLEDQQPRDGEYTAAAASIEPAPCEGILDQTLSDMSAADERTEVELEQGAESSEIDETAKRPSVAAVLEPQSTLAAYAHAAQAAQAATDGEVPAFEPPPATPVGEDASAAAATDAAIMGGAFSQSASLASKTDEDRELDDGDSRARVVEVDHTPADLPVATSPPGKDKDSAQPDLKPSAKTAEKKEDSARSDSKPPAKKSLPTEETSGREGELAEVAAKEEESAFPVSAQAGSTPNSARSATQYRPPRTPARRGKDGKFPRPRGGKPKDCTWDHEVGMWKLEESSTTPSTPVPPSPESQPSQPLSSTPATTASSRPKEGSSKGGRATARGRKSSGLPPRPPSDGSKPKASEEIGAAKRTPAERTPPRTGSTRRSLRKGPVQQQGVETKSPATPPATRASRSTSTAAKEHSSAQSRRATGTKSASPKKKTASSLSPKSSPRKSKLQRAAEAKEAKKDDNADEREEESEVPTHRRTTTSAKRGRSPVATGSNVSKAKKKQKTTIGATSPSPSKPQTPRRSARIRKEQQDETGEGGDSVTKGEDAVKDEPPSSARTPRSSRTRKEETVEKEKGEEKDEGKGPSPRALPRSGKRKREATKKHGGEEMGGTGDGEEESKEDTRSRARSRRARASSTTNASAASSSRSSPASAAAVSGGSKGRDRPPRSATTASSATKATSTSKKRARSAAAAKKSTDKPASTATETTSATKKRARSSAAAAAKSAEKEPVGEAISDAPAKAESTAKKPARKEAATKSASKKPAAKAAAKTTSASKKPAGKRAAAPKAVPAAKTPAPGRKATPAARESTRSSISRRTTTAAAATAVGPRETRSSAAGRTTRSGRKTGA